MADDNRAPPDGWAAVAAVLADQREERRRRTLPRRQLSDGAVLAMVVPSGLALGAALAFAAEADWRNVLASYWLPLVVVGAGGGLANYLYRVTEGHVFSVSKAFMHTVIGAFFGPMSAGAADGMGATHSMQVAASGFGGGLGPRALEVMLPQIKKDEPK